LVPDIRLLCRRPLLESEGVQKAACSASNSLPPGNASRLIVTPVDHCQP
jgi:hypothetical protein